MATNTPSNLSALEAAIAAFTASQALPKDNYPPISNSGMFPSPKSPYNSLSDQTYDAFMMSGTLPGAPPNPMLGNTAPRYNFANAAPNMGGATMGASAYSGGWSPWAGRGNGGPGAPPAGGPPGAPPPAGPPAGGPPGAPPGGIFPPPPPAGPPGGIVPPRPPNAPGPVLNGPPANIPPGTGDLIRNQPPPISTPPPPGVPPLIRNQGGPPPGGVFGGAPGVPAANFQTPSAAVNTASNQVLAQRATPADMAELISRVGETAAHQMMSYYGPLSGGKGYDPQATADLVRGDSGGIDTLMPAIKERYLAEGVIGRDSSGKEIWLKKQDAAGNFVPIKGA